MKPTWLAVWQMANELICAMDNLGAELPEELKGLKLSLDESFSAIEEKALTESEETT